MGAWCAYEVNRLKQELTTQTERVKELEGLLKYASCPDHNCDKGIIPHQVSEDEWEPEQCQWCYEVKQALKREAE